MDFSSEATVERIDREVSRSPEWRSLPVKPDRPIEIVCYHQ
ncbi:hypothetical protein V0288_09905 [Pannus brasiliensis CCIBt3594]|uniref:Uncharacterized protein n=1 Tax=Pannus brasiliensis CCIBt3594 TaxID=1427578 RepID=A0AAW9QHZ5_9CHRO